MTSPPRWRWSRWGRRRTSRSSSVAAARPRATGPPIPILPNVCSAGLAIATLGRRRSTGLRRARRRRGPLRELTHVALVTGLRARRSPVTAPPTERTAVTDHLNAMLLGMGNGAVYAALAIGLVIFYRSSGVLELRGRRPGPPSRVHLRVPAQRHLLVILPFLPKTIDLGGPWSFWPALIVTVLLEAVDRRRRLPLGLPPAAQPRARRQGGGLARADGAHGGSDRRAGRPGRRSSWPRSSRAGTSRSSASASIGDRLFLALTIIGIAARARRALALHAVRPGHAGGVRERGRRARQRACHPSASPSSTGRSAQRSPPSPAS